MLRVLKKIPVIAGTVILLLLVLAVVTTFADDQAIPAINMNDITIVLNEAKVKAKALQLPEIDETDDCGCRDAAARSMAEFNAPEFQDRLSDEQLRLRESIFKDILTESTQHNDRKSKDIAKQNDKRLYLFLSSSVPLSTLRNYVAMINRARTGQIIMVLRGFVGGMKKIRPTMEFIGGILKKDPACDLTLEQCDGYQVNIQVDPQLFQRFAVDRVPTLAYLPVSEDDAEDNQTEPIIVSGDASLDYLLERINRQVKSSELDTLIAALRGGTGRGE